VSSSGGERVSEAARQQVRGLTQPLDARALIAVDLGAESCRVSLLRWIDGAPRMELVHRFANAASQRVSESAGQRGLRWDLGRIVEGVEEGLRRCVEIATEGIRSIAVDGWAVDYVRLSSTGDAVEDPFCYRDSRCAKAEISLHERIAPERLRALTGVQMQSLNTVYQLHADALAGEAGTWVNLPEYLLYRWGGEKVSERTNATHTGLVGLDGAWCEEIFAAAGVRVEDAPRIVEAGTDVGQYSGEIEGLRGARLIAPCCHDTASAVAGIPASGDEWAYISSGTWSLVGTVLNSACVSDEAARENFTNLGAAGGRILFHKGMHGMWLLRQCMEEWNTEDIAGLVAAAHATEGFSPEELIAVEHASLAQPGGMPGKIHALWDGVALEPARIARLIFESLAMRYAEVIRGIEEMTGKRLLRVYVVGGGSQNFLLNELTAKATGVEVLRGAVESSTVGNFAVQMGVLTGDISSQSVARWAEVIGLGV
jgi:rhamnulokinase